jgi:hypothetical protein
LKTIPAFKPLPPVGAPFDLNASEKTLPVQASGSSWSGQPPPVNSGNGSKEKQRKKPGRKSTTLASPKVKFLKS